MKDEELAEYATAFKDMAKKNAVMFCWAVNTKLKSAIEFMELCGFKYSTNICWVKTYPNGEIGHVGGRGIVLQSHELLLIGISGRGLGTTGAQRHRSVFQAVGGANSGLPHSSKPHNVYKYIDSLWPHVVKLELFAREDRKGWIPWGNELKIKD